MDAKAAIREKALALGFDAVGFAPARNWLLNGTYYMNDRFVDAPGAIEREYDRYQIDLNYRF